MDERSYTRRLLHRWLVEYNPLYLFSAALVLGGIFLLSRGLTGRENESAPLAIAGVAEVYAVALIGSAAFLTRLGHRRPAVMLAFLSVLHQCDLTLHTERCVYLGTSGAWASVGWLIIFVAKLHALAWAMRLRPSRAAVATATLGAAGLAIGPHLLRDLDAGHASGAIALWLFALGSLVPFAKVASKIELDPWGRTVLRRSLHATWLVWGLLLGGHLLFWATQHSLRLAPILCVVPFVVAQRARTETWVWTSIGLMLVCLVLGAPGLVALASLSAAATLAIRAVAGARSPAQAEPVRAATPSPYRAGQVDPPPVGAVAHVLVAVDRAERVRLLTGALLGGYAAVWLHGWSGGALPGHVLSLDIATVALALVLAWGARTRVPLYPVGSAAAYALVSSGIIPTPQSTFAWGASCVALGFATLLAGLAVSYRLREHQAQ